LLHFDFKPSSALRTATRVYFFTSAVVCFAHVGIYFLSAYIPTPVSFSLFPFVIYEQLLGVCVLVDGNTNGGRDDVCARFGPKRRGWRGEGEREKEGGEGGEHDNERDGLSIIRCISGG